MLSFIKYLYLRFLCFLRGHSHPWFICFYCGSPPAMSFQRDQEGNTLRDEHGNPLTIHHGRKFKQIIKNINK